MRVHNVFGFFEGIALHLFVFLFLNLISCLALTLAHTELVKLQINYTSNFPAV